MRGALTGPDLEPDAVVYKVRSDARGKSDARAPIGPAPHSLQTELSLRLQPSFPADWSSFVGSNHGAAIGGSATEPPELIGGTRLDALPDPTMSGVFPDPGKLQWLIYSRFECLQFKYGSIRIGGGSRPVCPVHSDWLRQASPSGTARPSGRQRPHVGAKPVGPRVSDGPPAGQGVEPG